MKVLTTILSVALLLFLISGCSALDSGRPMPTRRLEPILPDSFGEYKQVNTVRNAGGPPVSQVTGIYKTGKTGDDGEIRIVIEDWGATKNSPRLPVDKNANNIEYRGYRWYPGTMSGSKAYQIRVPISDRLMLRIEWEEVTFIKETEVLDAIKWDYIEKISPKKPS